jgi:hypothetical protein
MWKLELVNKTVEISLEKMSTGQRPELIEEKVRKSGLVTWLC